jgi:hypothetical protein
MIVGDQILGVVESELAGVQEVDPGDVGKLDPQSPDPQSALGEQVGIAQGVGP